MGPSTSIEFLGIHLDSEKFQAFWSPQPSLTTQTAPNTSPPGAHASISHPPEQDTSTLCHSRHHHSRRLYCRSERPPGAHASFSLSAAADTTFEASIAAVTSFRGLHFDLSLLQLLPSLPQEPPSLLSTAPAVSLLQELFFTRHCHSRATPRRAF